MTVFRNVVMVLMVLLYPCMLSAQAVSTARLSGTIKDGTGALLPGAQVKAIQTATGAVRIVKSGADGTFSINPLATGPYRLEVSMSGFSTFVQEGIVLEVGDSPEVNPVLKVGQVSDRVIVEASGTIVETQQVGVGQVIDQTIESACPKAE